MDRVPPQNLEAEAALLGSLILEPDLILEVATRLEPSDFYSEANAEIYGAIRALNDAGTSIDKIALVERLRQDNTLSSIGGPAYLSQLMEAIPSNASAQYYAAIIAEKALLRRLIRVGEKVMTYGYAGEHDPEKALSRAVEAVYQVATGKSAEEHLPPLERLLRAQERAMCPDKSPKLATPWPALDEKTGGFYPGQLIVWGGAPAAGKTAGMLQLAEHVARRYGQVVLFALEMDEAEMSERQLAFYSGVSVIRQRSGHPTREEANALGDAVERGQHVPLQIVRSSVRSIGQMRRTLLALARHEPIRSIIVDHVGKIADVLVADKTPSKVERLDSVYQELNAIGREFVCPMHVVQHINRAGQASDRPRLIDLRDGGNPEGHANAVLFFYREDPMNLDGRAAEGEIIISKSRNGEAGVIPMNFDGLRGIWRERTPFQMRPEISFSLNGRT